MPEFNEDKIIKIEDINLEVNNKKENELVLHENNILPEENQEIFVGPDNAFPREIVEQFQEIGRFLGRAEQLIHFGQNINMDQDPDELLFANAFGEDEIIQIDDENVVVPNRNIVHEAVYQPPVGHNRRDIINDRFLLENDDNNNNNDGQELQVNEEIVQAPIQDRIRWRPIFQLGGYVGGGRPGGNRRQQNMGDQYGNAVRTLGRAIFYNIPCFQRMAEDCRRQNRDPLGEVNVISRGGFNGNNTEEEMNYMSNWIRQNGQIIDNDNIEFPNIMAGYRPNIILATSENDSFLLVEETVENGAPAYAQYIYSWRGGRQFYPNNQFNRLNDMIGAGVRNGGLDRVQVPAQIGQIRQENPQIENQNNEPRQIQEQPVQRIQQIVNQNQEEIAPQVLDKPEKINNVEVNKPKINLFQSFKQDGFEIKSTENGLAFVKELDNGTQLVISNAEGRSITVAKNFRIQKIDNGNVLDELTSNNSSDIISWIDNQNVRMKP
jgi:hypothetical protein